MKNTSSVIFSDQKPPAVILYSRFSKRLLQNRTAYTFFCIMKKITTFTRFFRRRFENPLL